MGTVFAGWLKILPVFLVVIPGIAAKALYGHKGEVLHSARNADDAYPFLLSQCLPVGVTGLLVAVVLSSSMSALASLFASSTTLVANDICGVLSPTESAAGLKHAGRITAAVMIGGAALSQPIIMRYDGLFSYTQVSLAFLTPPITATYVGAVFTTHINETGATVGLVFGGCAGVMRFILTFFHVDRGEFFVADLHYLHFAFASFVITLLVQYLVSACVGSPGSASHRLQRLRGLTYWTTDGNFDNETVTREEREEMTSKATASAVEAASSKDKSAYRESTAEISVSGLAGSSNGGAASGGGFSWPAVLRGWGVGDAQADTIGASLHAEGFYEDDMGFLDRDTLLSLPVQLNAVDVSRIAHKAEEVRIAAEDGVGAGGRLFSGQPVLGSGSLMQVVMPSTSALSAPRMSVAAFSGRISDFVAGAAPPQGGIALKIYNLMLLKGNTNWQTVANALAFALAVTTAAFLVVFL
jgi:hypothetical protein